jgi:hypothetical protein
MKSRKNLVISAIAALSGASMLALMSPASALTLAGSTLDQTFASSQVDLASWHGGRGRDHMGSYMGHGGYHGGYYWGHGYGWGYSGPSWGSCSIYGGPYRCYYPF